ncbi:hypothetical protein ABW20_dc0103032 [Dactylellina cionopaga]|nr:hypothetical protein ABW20_dc0103032 [Dactylellina cionopaga]
MFSSLGDVRAILDTGAIPAAIVKGDTTKAGEKIWLEAVSFESCRPVALSHVWSDGLGNVHANSIPECQVRRLQGLVENLYVENPGRSSIKSFFKMKQQVPIGLWLDTLCIPLEKDYRKLAIKRMVDTYAKSDRVLMIDAELTRIPMDQIPKRELLVRIAGSNWMRRMWTLQEAALNIENLYIQFADGVLKYNKEAKDLTWSWERQKWVYEAVDSDIGTHNHEFSSLRGKGIGPALSGFAGRNTSRAGDVYLCLGGMMDLNVGEIQNTPDDQRTQKLLSMIKYYPKSIIFSQGPKLDLPGYRWACETFWKSKILSSAYNDAMNAATMKEEGLRLEYQGYIVKPFKLPEGSFIMNSKKQGLWIKVTYDPADPVSVRDKVARTGHNEENMELGLIVPERDVARKGPGAGSPALLVSIYKTGGWKEILKDNDNSGALYSKTLCTVLLTAATDDERQKYVNSGYEIGSGRKPNESQTTTSVIYLKQIWFVA